MEYRLSAEWEALHFLRTLRKIDQGRLVWWLERLSGSPFTRGQSVVIDSTGRKIQISRVDRFRVFHWTDHAVKSVEVTKMEWGT